MKGKPFRRRAAGAATFDAYAEQVARILVARGSHPGGPRAVVDGTFAMLSLGASAELLRDAFVLGWSAPDCAQAFVHGLAMLQAADARAKGRLQ
jgi:hypothetical protein